MHINDGYLAHFWANFDPDIFHRIASQGHDELSSF